MRRAAMALAFVLVAGARSATADEPPAVERARAHYDRGIELFNAGEHPLALVELRRAYEIAPTHRLLYFIGQAEIRVGALAEALQTLEGYLEESGAEVAPGRRDEVLRDIAGL